jgi:hypothetical protein
VQFGTCTCTLTDDVAMGSTGSLISSNQIPFLVVFKKTLEKLPFTMLETQKEDTTLETNSDTSPMTN